MVSDSVDPCKISSRSQFNFKNYECTKARINGAAATTTEPSFRSSLKVHIGFNQITDGDGTFRNDVRFGKYCDKEGMIDNGGSSSSLVANGNMRSSTLKQTRVDPISIFDREHAVRKPFDGNLRGDYICSNCSKDVTTKRINCKVCFDFDLCVDCFSAGIVIGPHKKHHSCRLIEVVTGKIVKPPASKLKPSIKLMKKKTSSKTIVGLPKDFLKKLEINFSVHLNDPAKQSIVFRPIEISERSIKPLPGIVDAISAHPETDSEIKCEEVDKISNDSSSVSAISLSFTEQLIDAALSLPVSTSKNLNIDAYIILMNDFCKEGKMIDAYTVLVQMIDDGFQPDGFLSYLYALESPQILPNTNGVQFSKGVFIFEKSLDYNDAYDSYVATKINNVNVAKKLILRLLFDSKPKVKWKDEDISCSFKVLHEHKLTVDETKLSYVGQCYTRLIAWIMKKNGIPCRLVFDPGVCRREMILKLRNKSFWVS